MDGVAKVFQSNTEIYAGVENIKKNIKAPNLMDKIRPAMYRLMPLSYMDGFVQERRNSIANALGLRLSCTNPSICQGQLTNNGTWFMFYTILLNKWPDCSHVDNINSGTWSMHYSDGHR